MPNDTQRHRSAEGRYVTIDGDFVRNEAREAVRQFFRPLTAPFEVLRRAPAPVAPQTRSDRRR